MKKILEKVNGRNWIRAEITLDNGKLSITGTTGKWISDKAAKREAFRYWVSFFEDDPAQIYDMKKRFPEFKGYSPKSAARFVLAVDGQFHGLDIDHEDNGRIYIVESGGQIPAELAAAFPQIVPLLPYHLNDMHAECQHQEARHETWTTHPGAVCPDCGYKLGSAWLKRELPQVVIDAVNAL